MDREQRVVIAIVIMFMIIVLVAVSGLVNYPSIGICNSACMRPTLEQRAYDQRARVFAQCIADEYTVETCNAMLAGWSDE